MFCIYANSLIFFFMKNLNRYNLNHHDVREWKQSYTLFFLRFHVTINQSRIFQAILCVMTTRTESQGRCSLIKSKLITKKQILKRILKRVKTLEAVCTYNFKTSRDAYVEFSQDYQPGSYTGPRIYNTFLLLEKSQAKGLL